MEIIHAAFAARKLPSSARHREVATNDWRAGIGWVGSRSGPGPFQPAAGL